MCLFLLTMVLANGSHVSLDLRFSLESPDVPSRALVASMRVGVPQQRFSLLLDWNSSRTGVTSCLEQASHTYDTARHNSSNYNRTDVFKLEEDSFSELRSRGIFRMPLQQTCGTDVPPTMLGCTNVERCHGVLGLNRQSHFWPLWSAFTLTREALFLGRTHPDVLLEDDGSGRARSLECLQGSNEKLCEFEARLLGFDVLVDFHTHDSYIYLPAHIHKLYMDEMAKMHGESSRRVLRRHGDHYHIDEHGGHRRVGDHHTLVEHYGHNDSHKRHVRDDDDDDETPAELHRDFTDVRKHLERSQLRAMEESPYFRAALRQHEWWPLVFEPRDSTNKAVIVLDRDLIVYDPGTSSSFGGAQRPASEGVLSFITLGLGGSSGDVGGASKDGRLAVPPQRRTTSLLRASDRHDNRVSIGNGILKRYTLHRDLLRKRMLVETHVYNDHLTTLETVLATMLVTLYIRSLCYSFEVITPLALCLQHACRACLRIEDAHTRRRRVTAHSWWEASLHMFVLLVPPAMLIRLATFIDPGKEPWVYAYAWTSVGVNTLALLSILIYALVYQHNHAIPSGGLCWRTFRAATVRFAASEHLMLLGLLFILFVLRGHSFASLATFLVAIALVANAARHCYQVLRAGYTMFTIGMRALERAESGGANQLEPLIHAEHTPVGGDRPSPFANFWWLVFVILIEFLVNFGATVPFVWIFILYPFTGSHRLATLVVSLSMLIGVMSVHRFINAEVIARVKALETIRKAAGGASAPATSQESKKQA